MFPKFIISFSGAVFRNYLSFIDRKLYGAFDFTLNGINSMHISGKKDPLYFITRKEP